MALMVYAKRRKVATLMRGLAVGEVSAISGIAFAIAAEEGPVKSQVCGSTVRPATCLPRSASLAEAAAEACSPSVSGCRRG